MAVGGGQPANHADGVVAGEGPATPHLPKPAAPRPSQLDADQEQFDALLARYPNITAMRVFQGLHQSGYSVRPGSDVVRCRLLRTCEAIECQGTSRIE